MKKNVKQILEILWQMRESGKFYFINYGEDMINDLIKQCVSEKIGKKPLKKKK